MQVAPIFVEIVGHGPALNVASVRKCAINAILSLGKEHGIGCCGYECFTGITTGRPTPAGLLPWVPAGTHDAPWS